MSIFNSNVRNIIQCKLKYSTFIKKYLSIWRMSAKWRPFNWNLMVSTWRGMRTNDHVTSLNALAWAIELNRLYCYFLWLMIQWSIRPNIFGLEGPGESSIYATHSVGIQLNRCIFKSVPLQTFYVKPIILISILTIQLYNIHDKISK